MDEKLEGKPKAGADLAPDFDNKDPGINKTYLAPAAAGIKSGAPSKTKAMSEALEQIAQENSRAMPLFKRGPEVELASQQDVEMLKQTLAANKVHIPTKSLEKGIIMPRDLENYHPGYLQVKDFLT